MPGLIDAHVHYAESCGPAYLAAGVTTVRDVGNDLGWILVQKKKTLGDPAREGDLYAAVDALTAELRQLHPDTRCRRGCSGCCETPTAVFEVTAREWLAIEHHVLGGWDEGRRVRLASRFKAGHARHLMAYRALGWLGHFEPLAAWYFRRHGYVCPFLEEGACGIYPVRPLVCRMYGHFTTRARWRRRRSIYGCRLQADYHETRLVEGRPQLPDAEGVWAKARKLTRVPFWRWGQRPRLLPEWIAARLLELPGTPPGGPVADGGPP
jgi:Fe-S-cluster containining protein